MGVGELRSQAKRPEAGLVGVAQERTVGGKQYSDPNNSLGLHRKETPNDIMEIPDLSRKIGMRPFGFI